MTKYATSKWERIAQTSSYKDMIRQKKVFLITTVVIYLSLFMLWPTLAIFTSVLNVEVLGEIPLTLIYAFAIFLMVLIITYLYRSHARKWDRLAYEAETEASTE